jgi:aspartyl-tRNA(Asn)/glutamyl-tRNA(Gln) amidotransferase subunit C
MEISVDEVRRIAGLAQLELDEQELPRYAQQLGAIIGFVQRLSQVDTEGVDADPGSPVAEEQLRPDRSQPGLQRNDALENAPEPADGHFGVPRVLG